jgi:hypothetical protein
VRVQARVPLTRILRLHVEDAPAVTEIVVVAQYGAEASALSHGTRHVNYIAELAHFVEDP